MKVQKSRKYAAVEQVKEEFVQAFQALAPQLQAREFIREADVLGPLEDMGVRYIEFGAEGATRNRVVVEQLQVPKDTPPLIRWAFQKRDEKYPDAWNTRLRMDFVFYERDLASCFLITGIQAHLGI
jgi:hypothetical protein